jgi:hypothetical protein
LSERPPPERGGVGTGKRTLLPVASGPLMTPSTDTGRRSKPAESVRLTDVPLEAGGRAYLVERGLEEEGSNANAALHALIADYLRQASVLDAVPMAEGNG